MKKIEFPVMNVKMVPAEKIVANDYNPNRMASPELKLLKISIEEDGYTQPIVVYYDKDWDVYEVVDGFHRYLVNKLYFSCPYLPVTVIDKPIDQRIASTIRHNRARGTHQILDMSNIVCSLIQKGWDDEKICTYLGMELDEVIRLKQISGLKEAFADHVFSKSWDEFERRLQEEEEKR
ncbi:MAG: ParB-like nuclease domain-containing protein [Clostridia bacterium]|nr:ParB-like nuclease domain-containing protein [Clostridia bacterium]MBQ4159129.1 ParB-like nuclease domain-containing protein [Clostridia bacterium]